MIATMVIGELRALCAKYAQQGAPTQEAVIADLNRLIEAVELARRKTQDDGLFTRAEEPPGERRRP